MKKVKLGELLEVSRGMSLSGKYFSTKGDLMRLTLGNFDYNNNCFKDDKSKNNLFYIGKVKPEFVLNKGDIITPLTEQAIGLLGSTAKIPCNNKYIHSQDVGLIKCSEKLNPNFAFYLISSKLVKNQLSVTAQQTKIRHTSPSKIKDCIVWIPDYPQQQKIGRILSSIDDKIAINNQINAILERVAKAIYEYYFVQFDFPNQQGKPYKSSGGAMRFDSTLNHPIPKDFEVQNLNTNSLTSIIPPNIEIFEGEKVYLPTANIQNDKIADFSNKITYKNRESRANMQPIANSVWFAKMKKSKKVLYFADYSQEWIDNLILSTGFYGLHCKNNSLEYIWNTINSTHFENQKNRLAHGATQQAVNNDDLLSIPLLIPTNEVIENFHNQVKSFYKQKYINELENQKLKNLRDFLLPLLINDQVQI